MEQIEKLPVFGYKGKTYFFSVYPLQNEYPGVAGVYMFTKRVPAPNALHTIILIGHTASFNNINTTLPGHCDCLQSFGANTICLMPVEKEEDRLAIVHELQERCQPECNSTVSN